MALAYSSSVASVVYMYMYVDGPRPREGVRNPQLNFCARRVPQPTCAARAGSPQCCQLPDRLGQRVRYP